MRWQVNHGDILKASADVLACSANVQLNLSGGVGGEILRRYGDAMQVELRSILAKRGIKFLSPGEVVTTDPHGLPFKWIIHAVAVDAFYKSSGVIVEIAATNALKEAARLGIRSVALTALATGFGRLSIDEFG